MVERSSSPTHCATTAETVFLPETGTEAYLDIYVSILNMKDA